MMHDFAITPKYAIFMDHALIFDPKHMIKEKSLPFRCAARLSCSVHTDMVHTDGFPL